MLAGGLYVNPVLSTKSQMGQMKNGSSKKKIALKKTDRANITATDFVWAIKNLW